MTSDFEVLPLVPTLSLVVGSVSGPACFCSAGAFSVDSIMATPREEWGLLLHFGAGHIQPAQ